ncbi:Uncharacterised protein [Mycobacterium tuberculosis]|nr:Uncharacterised protein [Mycobacterium tuberculosis]
MLILDHEAGTSRFLQKCQTLRVSIIRNIGKLHQTSQIIHTHPAQIRLTRLTRAAGQGLNRIHNTRREVTSQICEGNAGILHRVMQQRHDLRFSLQLLQRNIRVSRGSQLTRKLTYPKSHTARVGDVGPAVTVSLPLMRLISDAVCQANHLFVVVIRHENLRWFELLRVDGLSDVFRTNAARVVAGTNTLRQLWGCGGGTRPKHP